MPMQNFPYLPGSYQYSPTRVHSPSDRPPFAGARADRRCLLVTFIRPVLCWFLPVRVGSLATNGGSVSDLDDIARELDRRALQVEAAGAQLVTAAANALWTSIAADAFRARVDHRNHECARLADVLRTGGQTVRSFADAVAAEKARLRRLELAAEHFAVLATRLLPL